MKEDAGENAVKDKEFGEDVDRRFRQLTTLMYADIQLLKAGNYDQLIPKLRHRFQAIMGVATVFAVFYLYNIRGDPDPQGQVMTLMLLAFVLLWEASRLYQLSRIEKCLRTNDDGTLVEVNPDKGL